MISFLIVLFIAFSGIAEEVDLNYGQNQFVSDGILFEVNKQRTEDKMTAHGYDSFTLKANVGGKWVDLTLDNFRTIEGADCFVQDFIFQKNPFKVIRRERKFGDGWMDVKPVTATVYKLKNQKLIQFIEKTYPAICDVRNVALDC